MHTDQTIMTKNSHQDYFFVGNGAKFQLKKC